MNWLHRGCLSGDFDFLRICFHRSHFIRPPLDLGMDIFKRQFERLAVAGAARHLQHLSSIATISGWDDDNLWHISFPNQHIFIHLIV